jgi:hypothetical protein
MYNGLNKALQKCFSTLLSEWKRCLTPNEPFISHIMARTNYIRWDDNDVSFVLDQYP